MTGRFQTDAEGGTRLSRRKDTDYLSVSARIRVLETRLLNAGRMERMIEAGDPEDAAKVLAECGYGELSELTESGLERTLARAQAELFRDLGGDGNIQDIVDMFRSKYDYHNAKVLVKGEALGGNHGRLLVGGGRYDPDALAENYRRDEMGEYSEPFQKGVARAREALSAAGDPQLADFALDRACFREWTELADRSGSGFLRGYASLSIDEVNLRSAVRASRLDKGAEFLEQVLLPGGSVPVPIIAAARGDELGQVFRGGALAKAAELGASLSAPGSGPLTEFERLCGNAVMDYMAQAKRVPFGEAPVAAYLYARQAEMAAIRVIMTGHMAGLDGDTIRRRLRRTYA